MGIAILVRAMAIVAQNGRSASASLTHSYLRWLLFGLVLGLAATTTPRTWPLIFSIVVFLPLLIDSQKLQRSIVTCAGILFSIWIILLRRSWKRPPCQTSRASTILSPYWPPFLQAAGCGPMDRQAQMPERPRMKKLSNATVAPLHPWMVTGRPCPCRVRRDDGSRHTNIRNESESRRAYIFGGNMSEASGDPRQIWIASDEFVSRRSF